MARIGARQEARTAHLARARQGAEAIGRDVLALKDAGMTVSEVARRVGIPRPTLAEFVAAAGKAGLGQASAPAVPLPVLAGDDLVAAVSAGGPIVEIIASFADADTLFMSDESWGRFADVGWAHGMRVPNVMLRLEEAGWIGVDNCIVGYGGTGPDNAYRALVSVGIDEALADDIAYRNRVSQVLFDESGAAKHLVRTVRWPHVWLSTPEAFGEDHNRFRVKLLVEGPTRDEPDVLEGDSEPTDRLTMAQRWLRYLDDPPAWLPPASERRGTLFTSPEAAAEAGFKDKWGDGSPTGTYQLVIEQGPVQLWVTAYTSEDPAVWVPREFHGVLVDAGLLPEDVVEADAASALRKLITRRRNRRPDSIALGAGHARTP